jgi:hypothetical protein
MEEHTIVAVVAHRSPVNVFRNLERRRRRSSHPRCRDCAIDTSSALSALGREESCKEK